MKVADTGRLRGRTRRAAVVLTGAVVIAIAAVGASAARRLRPDSDGSRTANAEVDAKQWLAAGTDSLDAALISLAAASASGRGGAVEGDDRELRRAFHRSRHAYKRIEALSEFYASSLAAALNSRRQEVDDDDAPPPRTLAPAGFPLIEQMLYGARNTTDARTIAATVAGMRAVVRRLRSLSGAIVPTAAQTVEAARLEVARVSTLGIAGFDAPRTEDSPAILESAQALDGVRSLLATVGATWWPALGHERRDVDATLARAADYLRANKSFYTFDRLTFIAMYAEPVARSIDALRRAAAVQPVAAIRGWRFDVPSVYDAGAFDARVYANSRAPASTPALVALGNRLFNEPALSGTGTRSCASCHVPAHAFTDGVAREPSIDGHAMVSRHTPTLINAALQPAVFDDERAATLEDQVVGVLSSSREMASSVERAAVKLEKNQAYRDEFARAFSIPVSSAVSAVTPARLGFALAAYVRSLQALDSRFDRAARGDTAALTPTERRGFNLFMGKAGCGTCHFAPLFNGNTPPMYVSTDVEVIGTPASLAQPGRVDPDSGRAAVDRLAAHLHAFKTPTVRNAALTAPYGHNGVFRTLDDVIAFYDGGGAQGAGAELPNQTLSADSLHLTKDERAALVAFLGALTDTVVRAPR